MSWSQLQGVTTASGGGNSITNTYGSNTTSGSLLVAAIIANGTSIAGSSVSDSVNGAWTIDEQIANTTQMTVVIAHKYNPTGGSKPVVTGALTNAGGFIELDIFEYTFSGATTYSLDVGHAATGPGTAVSTGSSGTPLGASDLGFAAAAPQGSISSGTGGSWTYTPSGNGTGLEYIFLSSATAQTATFTAAAGNTQWAAAIALYKATGGTPQNATWSANPKSVLTISQVVVAHKTITFNPRATLTLGQIVLAEVSIIFSPKVTLTLNALSITNPTNVNATITFNPKPALSLSQVVLAQKTMTFSPRATLTMPMTTIHNAAIVFSPRTTLGLNVTGGTAAPSSGVPYSFWGGGIVY